MHKTTLTQNIIDQYARNWLEDCLYWFDDIRDLVCSRANEAWEQEGLYEGETHPISDLIEALEHDLRAAACWKVLEKKELWQKRARELGFKDEWEKQLEERKKRAAEERASASEGVDAK